MPVAVAVRRRARAVEGMDGKPSVILRAGLSPADDAIFKLLGGRQNIPVGLPIKHVLDGTALK